MRGLSRRVGRVLVVVSVAALLAVPAEARPPRGDDGWVPKIVVKMLKKLGLGTHGDMITIPRP